MLDFHPLQLEDLPKLRNFFQYSGSRVCDTTPGTVFIWRDLYKTEWAVYDGSLYFKVDWFRPHLYTAPWGRTAGALPADRGLLLPPEYAHCLHPSPKG